MSVIIRLQNLAWSATAVDIRHFFRGLSIPEGGVHIVGGEFGDAFIAFSTDEDARQAMSMNGSPLKGSPVKLLLSSRNEMQKVIDQAKQQSIAMQNIPQPNLAPRLSPGGQPRGPYSMGGGGPNVGFGNAPMGGNYGPGSGPMFHPNMPGNMPSIRGPQQGLLHPPGPGMAGQHGQQGPGNYYPGMDNPSAQDHVGAGGMMRRDGRGAGAGRDRDRDDKDRHRDHRRGSRDGGPSRHRSRSRSRERERPRHRSPSPDRRSGRGGRPSQEGRPKEGPGPMLDHGGMGSRIQLPDGLRLSENVLENLGRGGLLPLPAGSGNNGSFGPGGGGGGGFDEGQFHGGRDGEERMFSRNSGPDVDEFELMRRQRRGEDFPEPDTSVQIRMLHNDISYKDVREFFRGILIPNSGIKMINNIDGFRFGIAYVKFTREQDKQRALLKNGERHRGHVVNVYHVPDFVFDHAINSFMPSQSVDMPMFRDSCVAVRDVTPDMQPQDIAHALRFLAVEDIVIDRTVSKDQGRQWGIAYVRLTSRHDANALIRECRKGLCIFDQTLPIAFVPLDEMEKAKQANLNMEMMRSGQEMPPRPRDGPPMASPQRSPAEMRREGGPWMGPPTDVLSSFVLMKGLLPVVGERDVYDFFSDVGVVPLKVQVLMDHNRLPVGDAICEFANMDDAHRALSKNGNFMGGKAVHVRTLSIEEASDILGITLPNPGPPRRPSFNGFGEEEGPRMDGGGGGPPPHARDQFFGPNNGAPRPQRGPPGGGGGGGDLPPVDGFGRPGCVLAITNVPYKAGIKEILQFFDGFDITKECVLRRYNETGQPTGDARIAFSAPEQAERAFHVLENATIWGRTIKMMLL